jgi:predicted nucleic acid-binding protein
LKRISNLPIVISNASPIINLAIIGRLGLLKKFWGRIFIPEAVWKEVVIDGEDKDEVVEIKKADWIVVEKVKDQNLTLLLMQNLDKGESETIALAIEKNADIILLDETDAREAADIYKIEKTGVLGILLLAKLKNEIPSLKQEIEKLKIKANFRLKDSLIQSVLKDAGEIP